MVTTVGYREEDAVLSVGSQEEQPLAIGHWPLAINLGLEADIAHRYGKTKGGRDDRPNAALMHSPRSLALRGLLGMRQGKAFPLSPLLSPLY
jgi:hypothetical protein